MLGRRPRRFRLPERNVQNSTGASTIWNARDRSAYPGMRFLAEFAAVVVEAA